MKAPKPLEGNNCDTCEKRFNCFTSKQLICPIVVGENIGGCWTSYNNMAAWVDGELKLSLYCLIKPEQILKLLKKAKFRTYRKYGKDYLEVID